MQEPQNSLMAATFEKAKTYVFTEPKIRDREVEVKSKIEMKMGLRRWRDVLIRSQPKRYLDDR